LVQIPATKANSWAKHGQTKGRQVKSRYEKDFKAGGVALPGAMNACGATKKTPKYDKKLYEANKKSDRDKDGIACEK